MAFRIKTISGVDYLSGLYTLGLQYNNLTDINDLVLPSSLEELYLTGNQIVTFNPTIALPDSIAYLALDENQIVIFNPTIPLPDSLVNLNLSSNQIITFNPSIALPNSIINLFLGFNQIVTFNPSIALPNSLAFLSLEYNQMTTAGYTASEPWANAMSVIPARGVISFTGNINSVSGTTLETILISKGWTVNA